MSFVSLFDDVRNAISENGGIYFGFRQQELSFHPMAFLFGNKAMKHVNIEAWKQKGDLFTSPKELEQTEKALAAAELECCDPY